MGIPRYIWYSELASGGCQEPDVAIVKGKRVTVGWKVYNLHGYRTSFWNNGTENTLEGIDNTSQGIEDTPVGTENTCVGIVNTNSTPKTLANTEVQDSQLSPNQFLTTLQLPTKVVEEGHLSKKQQPLEAVAQNTDIPKKKIITESFEREERNFLSEPKDPDMGPRSAVAEEIWKKTGEKLQADHRRKEQEKMYRLQSS